MEPSHLNPRTTSDPQKAHSEAAPKTYDYLSKIAGNTLAVDTLFNRNGDAQPALLDLLRVLPLQANDSKEHAVDFLAKAGKLNLKEIECLLQEAFYIPNASKFSFEVAAEGAAPSAQQLDAFRAAGLVDQIRIKPNAHYDTGVIFGGRLGAIDGRTQFLLDQKATLSSVALLGGKRTLNADRELGEPLKAVIGEESYNRLEQSNSLPKTEYELMLCVWQSYCGQDSELRKIPVIAINSDLRLGHVREAPGTPETVVALANVLTNSPVSSLSNAPATFLLASSQPHAIRQAQDFKSTMALLHYPGLEQVDIVGYTCQDPAALKLYGQEIAKLVHAQFISWGTN